MGSKFEHRILMKMGSIHLGLWSEHEGCAVVTEVWTKNAGFLILYIYIELSTCTWGIIAKRQHSNKPKWQGCKISL